MRKELVPCVRVKPSEFVLEKCREICGGGSYVFECGVCREPDLVEFCLCGVGIVCLGEMEVFPSKTFDERAEKSVWFVILRVGVVVGGNRD